MPRNTSLSQHTHTHISQALCVRAMCGMSAAGRRRWYISEGRCHVSAESDPDLRTTKSASTCSWVDTCTQAFEQRRMYNQHTETCVGTLAASHKKPATPTRIACTSQMPPFAKIVRLRTTPCGIEVAAHTPAMSGHYTNQHTFRGAPHRHVTSAKERERPALRDSSRPMRCSPNTIIHGQPHCQDSPHLVGYMYWQQWPVRPNMRVKAVVLEGGRDKLRVLFGMACVRPISERLLRSMPLCPRPKLRQVKHPKLVPQVCPKSCQEMSPTRI